MSELAGVPTRELLVRYGATLTELERRGVVRTRNAPVGDYAEYLAAHVYSASRMPNSVKSYDLRGPDGTRYQVKTRTVRPGMKAGAAFSVIRSYDFDVMVYLALDWETYEVAWAREVPVAEMEGVGRFSAHINGTLVRIKDAASLGVDVTERFRADISPPQ
ncbi:hypothetical protein [Agrococcus lahaulensis]|uniref:hypothetical protein n=1 Tax=Agrococcus lahaulensis TaxID=341722 RepID=UPI000478E41A|nr:hypothetical protein [Agrococcus lahaulensis]